MNLPLTGIVVYELGSNVAGPFAGLILAELGAEVIKIERPGGDDARRWGPPFAADGTATLFHAINRNKRSVVVDMKNRIERDRLRERIVADADVVVQNLRPGAAARLGLDAAPLLADRPALVYCNLHAFGASGPLADRPGYDALMQAFGGIMSVTGEPGRPPVRAGISVIDMGTGMWCAIGILAALLRRAETGRGGVVDAALYETAVMWMCWYIADYQITGENPKQLGAGVRGIAPYDAYRCADGWLIVAASNDRLFERLADALGQPQWKSDPRYATNPARDAHRDALRRDLTAILGTERRDHWRRVLDAAGVPSAPTQTVEEVIDHPQTEAAGILQAAQGFARGLAALPLRFDGQRPPLRRAAPQLGQDDEVMNRR